MATYRPNLQLQGRTPVDFNADRLYTVTFEAGWNADAPPAGWLNNETYVTSCVREFMRGMRDQTAVGQSLVFIYNDGFRLPHVTKGFHQKERMRSVRMNLTADFCHLTVRLYKVHRYYKAVHLYFASDGTMVGATQWDERTNQAIS